MRRNRNGPIIVLEGIDGAGKSTQMKLLCDTISRAGRRYEKLAFPRYGNPSAALVEMYLRGRFGLDPLDVSPQAASVLYAVDRFASYREIWGDLYRTGVLILSDRYTSSNIIMQGAKLPEGEREAFWKWLYQFEGDIMGIPPADLTLYLDMPVSQAERLTAGRNSVDIHEADPDYQSRCARAGLQAAEYFGWTVIPCTTGGGKISDIVDIHALIADTVYDFLEEWDSLA